MTEGERARFVAWSAEMRAVHDRLREALHLTQEALAAGEDPASLTRELLLFCHGFCAALSAHHRGEDRTLFPAIAAAHPELADTLRRLEQDHSMIDHLIAGVEQAARSRAEAAVLERHLDGIAAVMESHFRYEERALLEVLEQLDLEADVAQVFGPL